MRLFLAADDEPTAIRRDAAVEDMHQRRLAGAVVTDDADALTETERKIGAVQSPDGAVGFFDTDEIDERSARVLHDLVCLLRGRSSTDLLHIRLDRGNGVGLCVFVAGDAALRNIRQFFLEIVLGEGKIGHHQIVGNGLVAIENLLRDPECER